MSRLPTFCRLFLLLTGAVVPSAFSQTASVGYASISGGINPASAYPYLDGRTTDTVTAIPFAFNSLGNYTLSSISISFSLVDLVNGEPPAGGPEGPGHGGDASGSNPDATQADIGGNLSLRIFSTLPDSLTLPTSLVTFSFPGGGPGVSPVLYQFSATSAPTFTAGSTYYLAISLGGLLSWDMASGASNAGTYPGDAPVTSLVGDGTPLVYYKITSGGVQNFYDNVGGFAIHATAVTAIPEPASVGAVAGLGVLAMAFFVRRRRRGAAVGSL